ncbi:unnamed protein product [Cercospora beticola]|nr:unnamed protein product [Cercospora beticola]
MHFTAPTLLLLLTSLSALTTAYDVSASCIGKAGNKYNIMVQCACTNGYRSCLPAKNSGGPNMNCSDYTRTCAFTNSAGGDADTCTIPPTPQCAST